MRFARSGMPRWVGAVAPFLVRRRCSGWRRHIVRCLASVSCVAACGCGQHDASDPSFSIGSYAVPVPGCEGHSYAACDVADTACQRGLFDLVRCVRETTSGEMVPVETITASQYRDRLLDSSSQDEVPENQGAYEKTLVFLGLASTGDLSIDRQVETLVKTVPAYYSSETKTITVVEADATVVDPTPVSEKTRSSTLAHEIVHALQDQQYDLSKIDPPDGASYDERLSRKTRVEGEAEFYQMMLFAAFSGVAQDHADYPRHFDRAAEYALQKYSSDSPYLIAPRIFPYNYGGRFCYLQFADGGRAGVDGWFADPPLATIPYILSSDGIVIASLSPVREAAPAPAEDATLVFEDTLGAWLVYEMLQARSKEAIDPLTQVAGWRGDRLWVYAAAEGRDAALIWRIRWDNSNSASAFANRAKSKPIEDRGVPNQCRTFYRETDSWLVAVSDGLDVARWLDAAKAPPADSTDAGPGDAGVHGRDADLGTGEDGGSNPGAPTSTVAPVPPVPLVARRPLVLPVQPRRRQRP
jgi:hypothetical protein